ncbi:hypothetical protein COSO111634_30710 [Corallococcus soli]
MAARKSRRRRSRPGPSSNTPSSASRSPGGSSPRTSRSPDGAFTSATAATSGSRGSAATTAVPPRLWPTSSRGAGARVASQAEAATTASTLGTVSGRASPAGPPGAGPCVKSSRSTAKPRDASARASRSGPGEWPRQAKHDTSTALATGTPAGSSSRPPPAGSATDI